ncbi:MAG: hypothetical protein ACR2GY_02075 [Phycisphaerales bacterium]
MWNLLSPLATGVMIAVASWSGHGQTSVNVLTMAQQDPDHPSSPKPAKPQYMWEMNHLGFLVDIFENEGFDPQKSYNYASLVMRETHSHAIVNPADFATYALRRVGYSGEQAEAATQRAFEKLGLAYETLSERQTRQAADDLPRTPLNKRPSYEWKANILGFVVAALKENGFASQEAYDTAKYALSLLHLDTEEARTRQAIDWRERNPQELLQEIFYAAGFNPLDAEAAAILAIARLNVQMPASGELLVAAGDQCTAYEVVIIYCDQYGQQRIISGEYFARNSWDTLTSSCPASGTCPQGEAHWYELTFGANCLTTPLDGECVWIRATSNVVIVDCDDVRLTLDCFEDTFPLPNCLKIGIVCGDEEVGPSGCPCD